MTEPENDSPADNLAESQADNLAEAVEYARDVYGTSADAIGTGHGYSTTYTLTRDNQTIVTGSRRVMVNLRARGWKVS